MFKDMMTTIMTNKFIKRLSRRVARAMVFVMAIGCWACGSVFDDEGDCDPRYYVRFVYDMNMLYADAFATQVGSVDLYVFNTETGEVRHFSDQGEALASGSYRMPLNLAPGKYEFVAWCGLADNDNDFTVPQSATAPEGLTCTMARSYDGAVAYSGRDLHAVFHGSLTAELPNAEGEHVYTVKLTKDTNNINLSLNHRAGALDPSRFEVTMTDDNGLMAYDNSLLTDEPIEYRPWDLRSGTLKEAEDTDTRADAADDEGTEGGFLIAELSTARLMANHNSRITITDKETGKVVFSIPFIQWALTLRSGKYHNMGEQEYLDREDDYNLMVFLDDDNKEGWLAVAIYINGWHIIKNGDVEL